MRRFWEADRGLTIVLVLLTVIIFVLPVVLNPDPAGRLGVEFAFSMLLLAGAFTTAESRRLRLAAVALTAATLLVRWGAAGSLFFRMAERLNDAAVFTTDSDFLAYRKNGRQIIPVIMPA